MLQDLQVRWLITLPLSHLHSLNFRIGFVQVSVNYQLSIFIKMIFLRRVVPTPEAESEDKVEAAEENVAQW